jgi:hypothetical protein
VFLGVQYPLQAPLSTANEQVRENTARIEGRTDRLKEERIMKHIILHESDRALTLLTGPLHKDIECSLCQHQSASVPVAILNNRDKTTHIFIQVNPTTPLTSVIPQVTQSHYHLRP